MSEQLNRQEAKREMQYTAKYVGKALGDLVESVSLPPSLCGQALLKSIEGIPAPSPRVRESFWQQLRGYNYRPAMAYAAAFALIVGVFYGFGFHRISGEIMDGNVAVVSEAVAGGVVPEATGIALDSEDDTPQAQTSSKDTAPSRGSDTQAGEAVTDNFMGAIGGSGKSELLKSQGGYDLYYRNNDGADPDKGNTYVTVEVINAASQEAVCQLSITGMDKVRELFLTETQLAVIGSLEDTEMALRLFDISDMANPVECHAESFPGQYLSARESDEFLYIAAFGAGRPDFAANDERITLPGGSKTGYTVLLAMETYGSAPAVARKVVVGGSDSVRIFASNAYISFTEAGDDGEPKLQVAQIMMDGLDMELGEITAELESPV